jgi:hypothetical protein
MRVLVRLLVTSTFVVGCGHDKGHMLDRAQRDEAVASAKQCIDAVDGLAPEYQLIGPRLSEALKMNRDEARRLMRDSVELLIATREMLCNASIAVVDRALARAPKDAALNEAFTRMHAAVDKLGAARQAYDNLLGAASSADVPVDQDALLQRFSNALIGQ